MTNQIPSNIIERMNKIAMKKDYFNDYTLPLQNKYQNIDKYIKNLEKLCDNYQNEKTKIIDISQKLYIKLDKNRIDDYELYWTPSPCEKIFYIYDQKNDILHFSEIISDPHPNPDPNSERTRLIKTGLVYEDAKIIRIYEIVDYTLDYTEFYQYLLTEKMQINNDYNFFTMKRYPTTDPEIVRIKIEFWTKTTNESYTHQIKEASINYRDKIIKEIICDLNSTAFFPKFMNIFHDSNNNIVLEVNYGKKQFIGIENINSTYAKKKYPYSYRNWLSEDQKNRYLTPKDWKLDNAKKKDEISYKTWLSENEDKYISLIDFFTKHKARFLEGRHDKGEYFINSAIIKRDYSNSSNGKIFNTLEHELIYLENLSNGPITGEEIRKYIELKKEGYIRDAEYQQHKDDLINYLQIFADQLDIKENINKKLLTSIELMYMSFEDIYNKKEQLLVGEKDGFNRQYVHRLNKKK